MVNYLHGAYGESFINIIHPMVEERGGELGCSLDKLSGVLSCDTRYLQDKYKAVGGHFMRKAIKFDREPKYLFSIVRDPVARFISQFYYIYYNVNKGNLEKIMDIDISQYIENIETMAVSGFNEQYIFLRDDKFDDELSFSISEISQTPIYNVEKTIREQIYSEIDGFISNYNLIGIVERFDQMMEKICSDLNLEPIVFEKKNKGIYSDDDSEITPEQINKINQFNWIDVYLYKRVEEVFF
jgi:hypothetical protein